MASCKKEEPESQPSENQETISDFVETEDIETTLSLNEVKAVLVGTWVYDETVTPKNFYGEHYNSEITKTNIKLRTTYIFKSDGSFSTGVSIVNMDVIEREYKALMVEGGRKEAEAQGKYLSTDNVTYFENRAKQVLKNICKTEKGKYVIEGNKIVYTIGNKETNETFTLKGNKLTIKGVNDREYSITLTKQ